MEINSKYKIRVFADTRPGGRPENQDTCAYDDTPFGFLITVCDGMGGGPAGRTASLTAANAIVQYANEADSETDKRTLIVNAVNAGHKAIIEAVEETPSFAGMGTTATVLLLDETSAFIAHVGDSRIYQFRRGRKKFRTFDHSLVFEHVKAGDLDEESARLSNQSNVITRALGITSTDEDGNIPVDVMELSYEPQDRFMLCTDGIWGMFPEKELVRLAAVPKQIAGAIDNLVVRVDEEGFLTGGYHDNLTVAMVETQTYSKYKEKMSTNVRYILCIMMVSLCISIGLNIYMFLSEKLDNAQVVQTDSPAPAENVNLDSLIKRRIEEIIDEEHKATNRKEIEESLKEEVNKIKKENVYRQAKDSLKKAEEAKTKVEEKKKKNSKKVEEKSDQNATTSKEEKKSEEKKIEEKKSVSQKSDEQKKENPQKNEKK